MKQFEREQLFKRKDRARDWIQEAKQHNLDFFLRAYQREKSHWQEIQQERKALVDLIAIGGCSVVPRVYIYGLVDPRDQLIHYVGATRNLTARLSRHLSKEDKASQKWAWIKELRGRGLLPHLIVLEVVEGPETENWSKVESFWIDRCLRVGMLLTNSKLLQNGLAKKKAL